MVPIKDNFRYIFPQSPFIYVTRINKKATAWYDVNNLPFTEAARYKEAEILEAVDYIKSLLTMAATDYHNGDYSQIFLGGHSQGAMIAFFTGVTFKELIGGVIGISGAVFPMLFDLPISDEMINRL